MPQSFNNSNNALLSKLDALTDQLGRLNDFYVQQNQRWVQIQKEPEVLRAKQEEQMQATGQGVPRPKPKVRPRPAYQDVSETEDMRLPPDTGERPPFGEEQQALRNEAQRRTRGLRSRLTDWGRGVGDMFKNPLGPAPPAQPANADNVSDVTAFMTNPTNPRQPSSTPTSMGVSEHDALTLAVLGEHGVPAPLRNMALDYYGFSKTIDWATGAANQLSKSYDQSPLLQKLPWPVTKTSLDKLSGVLGKAQDNKALLFASKQAYDALSPMGANLQGYQALGQQLGYGPSAAFGQAVFGIHNPLGDFSAAARVGGAYSLEAQALQGRMPGGGFGNGLTGAQAQAVMETLGGQGFSMQPESSFGGGALNVINSIPGIGGPLASLLGGLTGGQPQGNAAMIAQNFMRPLMERFPGLGAQDLGQFTGSLRYSGTSIQQLTDSLTNLGIEAKTANMTVGQMASSIAQTGQAFAQMGSSPQGGQDVGIGFTNVTGLPPGVANQFAQNPLFQAMGVTQGVMPAALGQMNPGNFTNMGLNEIQLLRNVTAGFNRNRYNKYGGLEVSGQQQQIAMIAQWSGLPYNYVKQMLGDMPHEQARANLQSLLGGANQDTGLWGFANAAGGGKLNAQQYARAEKYWNEAMSSQNLRAAGLSKKQITDLNHISGMRDRARALAGDISNAAHKDKWNQIQNKPQAGTMSIGLTPQAQKWFQLQQGPSPNARLNNAGQGSRNGTVTSYTGDVSLAH